VNAIRHGSPQAEEILIKGAEELGVRLTSGQVSLFLEYLERIKFWNKRINLIGTQDEKGIVVSHFLDSITVVPFIPENSKLLDIGSGAGFPGIPLKIVRPSLEITLLDSAHKRVFFMRDVIRGLKLKGIKAVSGRAENVIDEVPRAHFDLVVSRAVGSIEKLIEIGIPYLGEGGRIVLMRGKKGLEEWDEAKDRTVRGIELLESKEFSLPFIGHRRIILVIACVL
jgi:16S rRNA (guanine527-N7)-methyltransferase